MMTAVSGKAGEYVALSALLFQEDTFATNSLHHILSLLGSLDGFGLTLLTSLALNN